MSRRHSPGPTHVRPRAYDDVEREVLDLPAEDRARLTRKLLESLEGEECAEDLNRLVDPEVQAAWMPEIRRRMEQIRRGEVELIPHEEVFARLRRRFGNF